MLLITYNSQKEFLTNEKKRLHVFFPIMQPDDFIKLCSKLLSTAARILDPTLHQVSVSTNQHKGINKYKKNIYRETTLFYIINYIP